MLAPGAVPSEAVPSTQPGARPPDSWAKKQEPLPPPPDDPLPTLAKAPTCIVEGDAPRTEILNAWDPDADARTMPSGVDLRATGKVRAIMNASQRMIEVESRASDGTGFVVRGQLRSRFYVSRPTSTGLVTIGTSIPLSLQDVGNGSVVVVASGSAHLEAATTKLTETLEGTRGPTRMPIPPATVGCDQLSFSPRPTSLDSTLALSSHLRVAVTDKPSGAPLLWYDSCVDCSATLGSIGAASPKAERAGAPAEVLELRGRRKRVRFLVDGLIVEGWIDGDLVGRRTGPSYEASREERVRKARRVEATRTVRCGSDVALFTEGQRMPRRVRLGTVFAGTKIGLGSDIAPPTGFREVAVDGLEVLEGYGDATLFVAESDLARCHE